MLAEDHMLDFRRQTLVSYEECYLNDEDMNGKPSILVWIHAWSSFKFETVPLDTQPGIPPNC